MQDRPRILIVDRDPIVSEALSQQVNALGYDAFTADSDEDAIAQLEQSRSNQGRSIGVVLADQDARGMGHDIGLIRKLHRDWPTVVPVVVSAFRKVESAVLAMRLGAADYLLKPIAEPELNDAIERAVQRHLLQAERETQQEVVGSIEHHEPSSEDAAMHHGEPAEGWTPMPLSEAMKRPEKQILLAALEANGWNRSQTAAQLDINRTTLYKKIRQYRLDEPA